ncbi:MAG TPA: lipopolysaccharide kinase InaA family protein, partial [Thermoanaerobaculia bacterium]|nr:lipopolysaccharide kinase InaA family protein [Thermoanaerobaculia bacterium]
MSLDGELEVGTFRYPGRNAVVDAELVKDGVRIPVVVKKTRIDWRQRLGTTKAERSYRTAKELVARGIPTPEPLGFRVLAGESWFVARRVEGASQIRAWFLSRDGVGEPPPLAVPFEDVVEALGRLARRLHDAGVFFRDLSDGNVLVSGEGASFRLWVVDLNRARL